MSWEKGIQKRVKTQTSEELNEKLLSLTGELTEEKAQLLLYEFLRENVPYATELLFGVELFPFQVLMMKNLFNSDFPMYILSRGASKTFSSALGSMLLAIMNPGIHIGIIGPTFRQCLEQDHIVKTESGFKPIRSVSESEQIFTGQFYAKVLNKWHNAPSEGLQVHTESGYNFKAKLGHKVLVMRQNKLIFKKIEELDYIDCLAISKAKINDSKETTDKLRSYIEEKAKFYYYLKNRRCYSFIEIPFSNEDELKEFRWRLLSMGVSSRTDMFKLQLRIDGYTGLCDFRDNIGFSSVEKVEKLDKALSFFKETSGRKYGENVFYFGEYLSDKYGRGFLEKYDPYTPSIKVSTLKKLRKDATLDDGDREMIYAITEGCLYFDRFDKAVKLDSVETVDIEVEGYHRYWSEGFIHHNSKMICNYIDDTLANPNAVFGLQCLQGGRGRKGTDEWTYKFGSSTIRALPLGCLTGDTKITTSGGIVTLKSLFPDKLPNVSDTWLDYKGRQIFQRGGLTECAGLYYSGKKPTMGIETRNGFKIRGTLDHKVRSISKEGEFIWKELAELKKSDVILIDAEPKVWPNEFKMSIRDARLAGRLCRSRKESKIPNVIWRAGLDQRKAFLSTLSKRFSSEFKTVKIFRGINYDFPKLTIEYHSRGVAEEAHQLMLSCGYYGKLRLKTIRFNKQEAMRLLESSNIISTRSHAVKEFARDLGRSTKLFFGRNDSIPHMGRRFMAIKKTAINNKDWKRKWMDFSFTRKSKSGELSTFSDRVRMNEARDWFTSIKKGIDNPLREEFLKEIGEYVYADRVQYIDLPDGTEEETFDLNIPNENHYLANGIVSHNSGDKLRGYRFNIIIVDEALAIPSKILNEVIMPFLSNITNPKERENVSLIEDRMIEQGLMEEKDRKIWPRNKLIILSSASYKFSDLYKMYKRYESLILGNKHDEEGEISSNEEVYSSQAHRSIIQISVDGIPEAIYDEVSINQAKATMSESQLKREFGAQFTDESDGYFPMQKMESCTIPYGEMPHLKVTGAKGIDYLVAIDPSWSGSDSSDNFALHVFELDYEKRKKILVHSYALPGKDLQHHIKYLAYILEKFNVVSLVLDYNGGVIFLQACNESTIFQSKGLNIGVIELDIENTGGYIDQLKEFKKKYDPSNGVIAIQRKPTGKWIQFANESLQADIDHKRILFASLPSDDEFRAEAKKNIPVGEIDFYPSDFLASNDNKARMIDFVEWQKEIIENTKNECANIQVSTTVQGNQSFNLNDSLKGLKGKNKPRKDSYSALLLGCWMSNIIFDVHDKDLKEEESGFMPFFC